MVKNYRLGTRVQRFVHTRIKSVVVTLRYMSSAFTSHLAIL